MPDALSIEILTTDDRTVVRVAGEVDLATQGMVDAALAAEGIEPRALTVDLAGVTFLDSAGLRMLVLLHQRCADNGGSLVVTSPPPAVQTLFEITGLDSILTIT